MGGLKGFIDRLASLTSSLEPVGHPGEYVAEVDDAAELFELFQSRFDALGPDGETSLLRVTDSTAMLDEVVRLTKGVERLYFDDDSPRAHGRVGISHAAALVAETGTVVANLESTQQGWSSLLVEQHIVVGSLQSLVRSLDRVWPHLDNRLTQVLISGPSRTADIEKTLVIPAHGPQRMDLVLCESELEWETFREALKKLRKA